MEVGRSTSLAAVLAVLLALAPVESREQVKIVRRANRNVRDCQVRRLHGRAEELHVAFDERLHGGRLEEIGTEKEEAVEGAARGLPDVELQIEAGGVGGGSNGSDPQSRKFEFVQGRVLQRQRDLEDRIAAEVAFGLQVLDQPLEGQLLMREGVECDLPGAAQQFAEVRPAAAVDAQDERVDEEADERLQFRPGAIGDSRADGDVGFAGHPV